MKRTLQSRYFTRTSDHRRSSISTAGSCINRERFRSQSVISIYNICLPVNCNCFPKEFGHIELTFPDMPNLHNRRTISAHILSVIGYIEKQFLLAPNNSSCHGYQHSIRSSSAHFPSTQALYDTFKNQLFLGSITTDVKTCQKKYFRMFL